MGPDTTRLGQVAAELMERLAEDHEDTENARVGVVALVVEIDGETDGEGATWIEYRCSDSRRWIQAGLFDRAKAASLSSLTE